jgi:hypothetical protein
MSHSRSLSRVRALGVQLALHIAMMDHGIEHDLTAVIAADLGIAGVEDLADMPWAAVLRVPHEWHQRIMDLRNSHIRDNQTMWTSPLE